MNVHDLWAKQTPLESNSIVQRKDIAEGRVPELPFYVVGQQGAKTKIASVLSGLDGLCMQTLILRADYGVGKTNMLKYLDLYFRQHPEYNVKVLYQNTNVDQRDLFMVLLRQLQLQYLDDTLVPAIKQMRENKEDTKKLVDDFKGEFAALKEYIELLFSPENDDLKIKDLLLVGTGQLYSLRIQRKIGIQQTISNFERRLILVLFLNILASCHKYVIFAIDEVENMYNVSKKRMALYLTTYRDLFDKFSFIKGHLLLLSITRSVEISTLNPPFYDRIKDYIIDLELLTEKRDILTLMHFLQSERIVETTKSEKEIEKIALRVSNIQRINPISTRELVRQLVAELVNEQQFEGLEEYLNKHDDIRSLYDESQRFLALDGMLSDVPLFFFDPLEYYMESIGYTNVKSNLKRRDYQSYIDIDNSTAIMFSFNNSSKIYDKISKIVEAFNVKNISLFLTPNNEEITYSLFGNIPAAITIQEYEPEKLLILLDMYKNHIEKQEDISHLIHQYTQNTL